MAKENMEQIELTTAYVADPRTTSTFQVVDVYLGWKAQRIQIGFEANNVAKQWTITGSEAVSLMTTLNKANLSTKSLHRRILEYAVAQGFLSGTISGTPD